MGVPDMMLVKSDAPNLSPALAPTRLLLAEALPTNRLAALAALISVAAPVLLLHSGLSSTARWLPRSVKPPLPRKSPALPTKALAALIVGTAELVASMRRTAPSVLVPPQRGSDAAKAPEPREKTLMLPDCPA